MINRKKHYLCIVPALLLCACNNPLEEATSTAVSFCQNIAEANFALSDIADPEVINKYHTFFQQNQALYKQKVVREISCQVTHHERLASPLKYRINFNNMNAVRVEFDKKEQRFKVQDDYQMTSMLFAYTYLK